MQLPEKKSLNSLVSQMSFATPLLSMTVATTEPVWQSSTNWTDQSQFLKRVYMDNKQTQQKELMTEYI